jgi:hypothetical protein
MHPNIKPELIYKVMQRTQDKPYQPRRTRRRILHLFYTPFVIFVFFAVNNYRTCLKNEL